MKAIRSVLARGGVAVCLALTAVCAQAASDPAKIQSAEMALKAKQYNKARTAFQPLAQGGNTTAQYRLGEMLRKGLGGKTDFAEALFWYRKSALGGDTRAQIRLGDFYRFGKGVPKAPKIAVSWYGKAAGAGSSWAQLRLGEMYRQGEGVEKNLAEARSWFAKAAAQGNAQAAKVLAVLPVMPAGKSPVPEATPKLPPAAGSNNAGSKSAGRRLYVEVPKGWQLADAAVTVAGSGSELASLLKLEVTTEVFIPKTEVERVKSGTKPKHVIASSSFRRLIFATPFNILETSMKRLEQDCEYGRAVETKTTKRPYGLKLVGFYTCTRNRALGWGMVAAVIVIETDKKMYLVERMQYGKPFAGNRIDDVEKFYETWSRWIEAIAITDRSGRRTLQKIGSGSGFRVNAEGHMLTNHHVIAACGEVRADGKRVTVAAKDKSLDLAILKGGGASDFGAFRRDRKVRVGEPVAVAGFPLAGVIASDMNLTTGVVSATRGMKDDPRFLQVSAPMQPGNSGGPAVDEGGRVIGVAVSVLGAARARGPQLQNVNFLVSGDSAKGFLKQHGVRYSVNDGEARLSGADLADRSRSFTVPIECWR